MAKSETKKPEAPTQITAKPVAEPTEYVIKEIMVQKNVSREKAIEILKNPSK